MILLDRFRKITISGFSLTELMVAVALLGIIGTLTIPTYRKKLAKARREECLSMLPELRNIQELYFNNNSITYNEIHCPKSGGALNTRDVGGTLKNVLVISDNISDKYCDYVSACNLGPPSSGTSNYCNPMHNRVTYQFAFKACEGDEVSANCPSNIADAPTYFPVFPNGSLNVLGFPNPSNIVPNIGTPSGILSPSGTKRFEFIVHCRGNIDEETGMYDVIAMDHTGATTIIDDDVNYN